MSARRLSSMLGLVVVAVAPVLAAGCGSTTGTTAASAGPGAAHAAAAAAPDFQLDTVDGARFRLADHRGKSVVVLGFWATWCDPCKLEMPHLVALHQRLGDRGLVIAAVSIDGPESVAQVRGEARQLGMTFPVLLDQESRVVALYNPRRSAPFTAIIDRAGRLVSGHEGYTPGDEVALAREIEAELGR